MGNNKSMESENVIDRSREYNDFYESLETIGHGSFAVVKKCIRKIDHKLFAVKIIAKSRLNQSELLSIKKEILILNKLKNINNVINIIDVFEDDKRIKIILELCESNDLFDLIANKSSISKKGGLAEEKCAQICAIIAVSLKYIHKLGIVHRDLKPENICFTKDGILKITDFGLAHIHEFKKHGSNNNNNDNDDDDKFDICETSIGAAYNSDNNSDYEDDDDYNYNYNYDYDDSCYQSHSDHMHYTRRKRSDSHSQSDSHNNNNNHGNNKYANASSSSTMKHVIIEEIMEEYSMETCCGTPQYVAPEVINKELYGSEVDLWSLGVVLYCMISGTQPFNSYSIINLYKLIINGQYSFPSKYWNDISYDAIDLIKKLMCVNRKKRITCNQLMQHPWITKHVPNIHVLEQSIVRSLSMQ